MSVLATGAAGFLGCPLVRRLAALGETVVAFDRTVAGAPVPAGVTGIEDEGLARALAAIDTPQPTRSPR